MVGLDNARVEQRILVMDGCPVLWSELLWSLHVPANLGNTLYINMNETLFYAGSGMLARGYV